MEDDGNKNELNLIFLAQNGDVEARNKLIKFHSGILYRIAWRWHKKCPTFEVDEYYNEAVIAAFAAIKNFDSSLGYKFLTYAVFVVEKHIIKFLRKRHLVKNSTISDDNDFENFVAKSESPFKISSDADEVRNFLHVSKKILPEKNYQIVALKLEGKTFEEICSSLNISNETVKQVFTRSIHRLMKYLTLQPEKT